MRACAEPPRGALAKPCGNLGTAADDGLVELGAMDVELREITSKTVRTICDLAVEEDQRSFVAPNAVSMAEAHFEPKHWMRAIYADGEPAGFVLLFEDPEEPDYFVWRLMVAAGFQKRGIGRRAMELLIER